ncbi:MAG: prepilin peptidase [Rickettsiaceae bacterium]|nr:prepilin peptidase [Rickettsiaceae bacterium]
MILIASYISLFLFGVLIGNFTTTLFYRLPRNIMISGFNQQSTRPPFCSNCKHVLLFYEYLPILSWFSTLGKCNYCHTPINKSYIALEILIGLIAIILYYLVGQNLEYFFLYFCLATLTILNIFIYLEHNFISTKITLGIIITGIIYRTLTDQEIFVWLASLSLACILSLWVIRESMEDKDSYNYSKLLVHLILPASLWCRYESVLFFIISVALCYLFSKVIKYRIFYPLGIMNLFFISLFTFMAST